MLTHVSVWLQAQVAASLDAQVMEVAKKLGGLEAEICELQSMAAAACKPFTKAEKVRVASELLGLPTCQLDTSQRQMANPPSCCVGVAYLCACVRQLDSDQACRAFAS